AVEDLIATFGDDYPKGADYRRRLEALAARLDAAGESEAASLLDEFRTLQREALLANPLVSGRPILFVVRRQYRPDHHNTATMFQTGEINTSSFQGGGALKMVDLSTGAVRTLLELPEGVARDPEMSFDGRKVLFSMRRSIEDDYHICEISTRGEGLRQLTYGSGISDIDPVYLPGGDIVFTSTREPKYCMCNRHIMGNLFRAGPDGSHIHQIGHSTLHEGHPALMPDGRILYDRWEYVDRNFGDAQGVWTCLPDGTNHAILYGNNTRSPGAVLDARVISGEVFVATFSSCHDRPWGAIAIVDRGAGIDGKAPVLRTWPPSAIDLVMTGDYDRFQAVHPKYEDPYPLSDPRCGAAAGRYFLCSRQVRGEEMGIFLIDTFGNEILLHAEPPGCFDPMPAGPRARPGVIPDRTDLAAAEGTFYVYDVYDGTGMQDVPRGSVKRLRVVESPEKRFWTHTAWMGSGTQAPAMAWDDFNNKRILGSAPVDEDGSAHFTVPADRFVYFQLLDASGRMVQSMRSGTIARPGETTGCIGCHEDRHGAVPNSPRSAIGRPPSPLEPWYGPERLFSYTAEVQPVLDRHCVSCHDFGTEGGRKLLLCGDLTLSFNVSYMEIRKKGLVKVVGAGPAETLPPYSWGSHRSELARRFLLRLEKGEVDAESFDRIATWIDINAPYYPSYASSYPGNLHGRSPLSGAELARLSQLTGIDLTRQQDTPQVSFTRPELSPCLARIEDPESPARREALEIIRAGSSRLAATPREDMPGARLDGTEAERQAKYERLAREEAEARRALAGAQTAGGGS
ncbi:MAG: hypothetical protein JXA90_00300, partial [Planctomycetes bacterium]|nr:hypothetical protein [Planctomycetota bacterium]